MTKTIFEKSDVGRGGFSFPPAEVPRRLPLRYARAAAAELPEVTEQDVIRHYAHLGRANRHYGLVGNPDGLKVGPAFADDLAGLPGFAELSPNAEAPGLLEVVYFLERLLCDLSGLDEARVLPCDLRHEGLAGLLVIRAFHEKHGSHRRLILVPEADVARYTSAAAIAGYHLMGLVTDDSGMLTPEILQAALSIHGRDVAALLVSSPNFEGKYEPLAVFAEALHALGAQLFLDGTRLNELLAGASPRDFGVDLLHFHPAKHFGVPTGGARSTAGPLAVRNHLAAYLPGLRVTAGGPGFVVEKSTDSIGPLAPGFGDLPSILRSLAFILRHGGEGMRKISESAVLNAQYLRYRLSTIGFPSPRSSAMLIQPTESESIHDLDDWIAGLKIKETFDHSLPHAAMDEIGAPRSSILPLDDRPR